MSCLAFRNVSDFMGTTGRPASKGCLVEEKGLHIHQMFHTTTINTHIVFLLTRKNNVRALAIIPYILGASYTLHKFDSFCSPYWPLNSLIAGTFIPTQSKKSILLPHTLWTSSSLPFVFGILSLSGFFGNSVLLSSLYLPPGIAKPVSISCILT